VACLGSFECVRDLSDTDVFAPIEPLARLPRAHDDPPGA
jgi:hypothetical protein